MYGWGPNQTFLEFALKGRRTDILLATKLGQTESSSSRNGLSGRRTMCSRRVRPARNVSVSISLVLLLTSCRSGCPGGRHGRRGGDTRAIGQATRPGSARRHLERIRRAHAVHPMSAIQTEYFLLSREEAEVMRPNTRDLAVSFVPFSPLGQGFLTGYVRNLEDLKGDRRAGHPRYREASFAHNRALVDLVEAIACEKNYMPDQLVRSLVSGTGRRCVPHSRHQTDRTAEREYLHPRRLTQRPRFRPHRRRRAAWLGRWHPQFGRRNA